MGDIIIDLSTTTALIIVSSVCAILVISFIAGIWYCCIHQPRRSREREREVEANFEANKFEPSFQSTLRPESAPSHQPQAQQRHSTQQIPFQDIQPPHGTNQQSYVRHQALEQERWPQERLPTQPLSHQAKYQSYSQTPTRPGHYQPVPVSSEPRPSVSPPRKQHDHHPGISSRIQSGVNTVNSTVQGATKLESNVEKLGNGFLKLQNTTQNILQGFGS